jgi:hypothetical protein
VPQVEEDFSFVVGRRRGLIPVLNFWQQSTTPKDVNSKECSEKNKRKDCVHPAAKTIYSPQSSAGENRQVYSGKQDDFDGVVEPPDGEMSF